ncbi:hypothetical protein [Scytonema millei]|uniref:hypothetical protein n=1 Tax=Scytonema millei TaxID=1245922 RepID=UPI000591E901|nr:hypothetical protein [Scytonema millei]
MKQGAFFSLALIDILGAIAIPIFPSFAQAQSTTRIGDLRQRTKLAWSGKTRSRCFSRTPSKIVNLSCCS